MTTVRTQYVPVCGVLASTILFVAAAVYYPGGTLESKEFAGYDWTRHFMSTLFAATALNGAPNPSRLFAIPAMGILCTSMAALFRSISAQSISNALRKAIEIGGIGSMVYAFLAVTTPMHDVLVSVGLVFFLTAVIAILQMLRAARRTTLLLVGAICLILLTACAVMYYGKVLFGLLPVTQKVAFIVCIAWLLAVHLMQLTPRPQEGSQVAQNVKQRSPS